MPGPPGKLEVPHPPASCGPKKNRKIHPEVTPPHPPEYYSNPEIAAVAGTAEDRADPRRVATRSSGRAALVEIGAAVGEVVQSQVGDQEGGEAPAGPEQG